MGFIKRFAAMLELAHAVNPKLVVYCDELVLWMLLFNLYIYIILHFLEYTRSISVFHSN